MPATLLDRIFSTLDVNSNGVIDTREFVQGLSVACRGTVEEKVQSRQRRVYAWIIGCECCAREKGTHILNEHLHGGEKS